MPYKWRRKVILAKIESTYGTDSVPAAGTDAMLVGTNVELTPLETELVARDRVQHYLGAQEQIPVNARVRLKFDVEAAGAGGAGTVPKYGPLLRGCGFAQTINAGVSVVYDPISTSFESLSTYLHIDGVRHKFLGARGNVGFKLAAGGIPQFSFDLLGLHVAPDEVALPTPTLTGFQKPMPATDANTPTFSLHAFDAILSEITLDLANAVQPRFLINAESVELQDRAGAGSCTIEAPSLASKNYFTAAKDGTTGALQLVHGVGAGKIVQLDAPAVQVLRPAYAELHGNAALKLDLVLTPTSAGNDEIKITVK